MQFVVTFRGVGGAGGTAIVDELTEGYANVRCSPTSWWQAGADQKVRVACQAPGAGLVVSVAYTRALAPAASYAYASANKPRAARYIPSSQYSTAGSKVYVTRPGPGRYQVHVPRVSTANGTFAVTSTSDNQTVCRLVSFAPSRMAAVAEQVASVQCRWPKAR